MLMWYRLLETVLAELHPCYVLSETAKKQLHNNRHGRRLQGPTFAKDTQVLVPSRTDLKFPEPDKYTGPNDRKSYPVIT